MQPETGQISSDLNEFDLLETIQEEVTADIAHSNKWRACAKEDYTFVAGPGQWDEADKNKLIQEKRPPVTFNKTLKFIRAICGIEVNNRQTTTYIPSDPTEPGEVKANEMASQGSEWMDAQCQAARKKSRSFRDMIICGMGFGESLIDFDDDPRGKYDLERCNPLEMGWDRDAREQNLLDAKRLWQIKTMAVRRARALLPGVTDVKKDGEYIISDEDLDASWATNVKSSADDKTKTVEQKEKREENAHTSDAKREVTIVRIQWWEYETYHLTMNPQALLDPRAEKTIPITPDQAKQMGGVPVSRPLRRKVFKQAFVGGKILQSGPCPRPDGFTFHCMTGEPDDVEGTWFGLVRLARDPQVWSNKFFSQLMHIINSTAKGGVLFETDAVRDPREFQRTYAKPNAATEVSPGAISKGKIMAKPGAGVTAGVAALLEITDNAFMDVLGINLELMGLADRDQPGVLEAQRKQSAMTILATLFDSLSMWEEDRGRTKLYFMQEFLADGRLIRIHGEDGFQALPLLKDKLFGKFDVIVDDAPVSTNMKEKAWSGLQMLLPAFQDMLTPKVAAIILDYVPYLPSKLVEALKSVALAPNPGAEEAAQLQKQEATAKIEKDHTSAILNIAKAAAERAKAASEKVDAFMALFGRKERPARTEPEDQNIIGPSGGAPALPSLPEIGMQPAMMPPEAAPQPMAPAPQMPGGLMPPTGLNGGPQ